MGKQSHRNEKGRGVAKLAAASLEPYSKGTNMKDDSKLTVNIPLISIVNDEPTTTSLAIAEGTEVQHKNVMELTRKYLEDLQLFGTLAFETRKSGGRPTEYAILNEPQSTLLITYLKNTEIVRKFKMSLVKAFFEAREQLRHRFDPAQMSRSEILRIALDAEEEKQKLAAQIELDKPKVQFAERHARADGWFCLRDAAKQAGLPPKRFNLLLHEHGYIYRSPSAGVWLPYSSATQKGLLDVKSTTIARPDGTEKVTQQCMVTAKGLQYFQNKFATEEAPV
ncbi:phage regulatory protein/antirepressor Ant [Cardiobacteriaceae bacterium TAE3-ERU3]|nr:phage regulatory protein/antirepressor Ant [Cardiobacteriaceae bacterium TAE3-ERU3]